MKTYEEVGKEAGLGGMRLNLFLMYMHERWADSEELKCQIGHASEWAARFKNGVEYAASDDEGREILDGIRRGWRL